MWQACICSLTCTRGHILVVVILHHLVLNSSRLMSLLRLSETSGLLLFFFNYLDYFSPSLTCKLDLSWSYFNKKLLFFFFSAFESLKISKASLLETDEAIMFLKNLQLFFFIVDPEMITSLKLIKLKLLLTCSGNVSVSEGDTWCFCCWEESAKYRVYWSFQFRTWAE